MDDVKHIVSDIKAKKLKPIYVLMGEEPYYIDKISEFIEYNVLDEAEKGFNQIELISFTKLLIKRKFSF